MMKRTMQVLLAALFLCISCASAFASETTLPEFRNVQLHDPSIIRDDDGVYYIYGSHMAAARSDDLMHWKLFSKDAETGCRLVENVQTEMGEALKYARTTTFWAPDVQRLADGRYYLYYCCCEGSSPLSCMGVAVSDVPEGPYKDLGLFLWSGMEGYDATEYPNVVDPNVFYDRDGKLWMVYGSYSGGIFILEMNEQTGFPKEGQDYGKKLLGGNHSRIEAPYILYSPDTEYYYLFLSFGGLNAADGYNIRVCRSKYPDGPYEDALGQNMIDCKGKAGTFFNDSDYEPYGVKLMGGYGFRALDTDEEQKPTVYCSPGHCSAIYEPDSGMYFLVFHTRFQTRGEYYQVRVHQMFLNEDGWPVVAPERYAGEDDAPVPPKDLTGQYKLIDHERDINLEPHLSSLVSLNEDGTISGDYAGTWMCEDGMNIALTLDGQNAKGVIQICYDMEEEAWTPSFTALTADGAAIWGVHAAHE